MVFWCYRGKAAWAAVSVTGVVWCGVVVVGGMQAVIALTSRWELPPNNHPLLLAASTAAIKTPS